MSLGRRLLRGMGLGGLLGLALAFDPHPGVSLSIPFRALLGLGGGALMGLCWVALARLRSHGRSGFWIYWMLMGQLYVALLVVVAGLIESGFGVLWLLTAILLGGPVIGLGLGVWFRTEVEGARWRDPI